MKPEEKETLRICGVSFSFDLKKKKIYGKILVTTLLSLR